MRSIDTFSKEELVLIANIVFETMSYVGGNTRFLEELLLKIIPFEESYCILSKVFTKADAGKQYKF